AIYSLMRNIGSSIGIAIVQTLLVRNTQIAHASLAAHINPANPVLNNGAGADMLNLAAPEGWAALNGEVTRQAAMIAYVDDFWLMMICTALVLPLLILIRPPRREAASAASGHAAME
ncbi:MAG TPA: EmrB/QacA family drug resistance transporter, partial [Telluria sp.]|nr:EmrB/QacA family drug resistance transporter [Telluria sp.]